MIGEMLAIVLDQHLRVDIAIDDAVARLLRTIGLTDFNVHEDVSSVLMWHMTLSENRFTLFGIMRRAKHRLADHTSRADSPPVSCAAILAEFPSGGARPRRTASAENPRKTTT